ncbi:MAG: amidohydrolase [Oscillospiraceae bacterium]|nr:amidohydrolase [Oscillospiraceae bacterium]
MDILFAHVTAVTMDPEAPLLCDAYVGVADGRIAYVGTKRPDGPAARTVDGRGHVLMPGLVNAHTHLPMTLLRGYADDYALQAWLFEHIFPAEARMDGRAVRAGTLLAIAEAVSFGTVSVSDMYDHCGDIAACVAEAGLKANLSRGVLCLDEPFDRRTHAGFAETVALCDEWHGYDGGRIRVDAAIHAEYTSGPALWEAVAALARERGLRLQVHLSETQREHERCLAANGLTPAARLARAGVFSVPVTAAHAVWLSEEDMDLLAGHGAAVVHCPVSNCKLASGAAPLAAWRRHGLTVALGTDGTASNNTLDLFEEIKLSALLAKCLSGDPAAPRAEETLGLAVGGGACAQGRAGETGRVAVGFDADLILLDFSRPHLTPCYDVVSQLVYAARGGDVVLTMVRGRVLYDHGAFPTIDIERVLYELRDYALPRVAGDRQFPISPVWMC